MNYLVRGQQSTERLDLLISLTSIRSEEMIEALRDCLVKGHKEASAAALNGVAHSNLTRSIAKLNIAAGKVEAIKEHDWAGFRSDK